MKSKKIIQNEIKDFISKTKILNDSKYYKTNKVSQAAWDSWAAQGKAGRCCICCVGYYNYSFHNKRFSTRVGKQKSSWSSIIFGHVCSKCYGKIEKEVNYKFVKY